MKLRVLDDSIRLRLTRSEVEHFGRNGEIRATTHFGPGDMLIYELHRKTSAEQLTASWRDGKLTVFMPASMADEWTGSGVAEEPVGFDGRQDAGEGRVLEILVEKDFKCLDSERDPVAEADAYPHPEKNSRAC